MAGERLETAEERLRNFGNMTLDEVAVQAAAVPGSIHAQVAELEIRRRVAVAQIEAAEAQKAATFPLQLTSYATVGLALATAVLAIATLVLAIKEVH